MIAVLDYGIGNLRSAQKAIEHSGGDARLVTTVGECEGASAVVLPGVGSFGACMQALRGSGLDEEAVRAVREGTPFLGICVGMQMLYEGSEESPDVAGLGILSGMVRRIRGDVKLPQMQWNVVRPIGSPAMLEGIEGEHWCYFVHSYAVPMSDDVVGTCAYGDGEVPALVQRGSLWATQFHPEKSSTTGLALLANFVEESS
jgi:glutamine amidotransferase